MNSNSAELFGRVDAPFNVFLNGFVGLGETVSGRQTDEDFDEDNPHRPYNDTVSNNNGHIAYAVADLGYDLFRSADYKIGPFVGYTLFNQYIFKSGCEQIANTIGNCIASSPPLASSQLIGLEDMTWQALRVGLSGQVSLTDRIKLAADAAYLPSLSYSWMDDHLEDALQHFMGSDGNGVQVQTLLSYDVNNRLSIGIGGRYWAMWSRDAQFYTVPTGTPAGPTRNAIELLGGFAQVAYRFDPDGAAKSGAVAWPLFKAPAASSAYNWTGLYGGIEGGGVFGNSDQIGQLTGGERPTAAATPSFAVDGGLLGGTLGYNSEFDRKFVFGFEGDMSWVDASGSAQQIPPFNTAQTASTRELWLATARARLGLIPADRWLVYATGGLAAADVQADIAPSTFFTPESYVRPGWTAGAGIEAVITGNWTAKIEYLFTGLENHAYFVTTPNVANETNRADGVPLDNNIIRAGINYKFGAL
jgi:opacity protein-like surface antigen